MEASAISAENLTYAYKANGDEPRLVFEDISFDVRRSEIVCLVGPSGCGKSTLLNIVAGFLSPHRGAIRLAEGEKGKTGKVGYIFQRDALLPWRSVKKNLLLADELRREANSEREEAKIRDYLKVFNLDESVLGKYPAELSGGMRQRVSIVQSLMTEPDILLLDEPFSALDFYTKLKLEGEFRAMVSGTGKAALFVTHDIDEAIAMGDRILVMGDSPKGIVDEVKIEFDSGSRLSPEAIRGHARFGEYFSRVWGELRENSNAGLVL